MTRTNLITANKCSTIVIFAVVYCSASSRYPRGRRRSWEVFRCVPIGRTYTHNALAFDAKPAAAFPAWRDCGTGGPIKHVAPTLAEVLRV